MEIKRNNPLHPANAENFLSRRAGFAERWALILFLLILSTLFGAAWFVRYPDLITLNATLDSSGKGYYIKTALHRDSAGNMHTGQKIQVRLDAYPFQEFGYVEGRLKQIAVAPLHDQVELLIEFPNGLVTSHHKTIPYSNGLRAQTLIVVSDSRLLEKLYRGVLKEAR